MPLARQTPKWEKKNSSNTTRANFQNYTLSSSHNENTLEHAYFNVIKYLCGVRSFLGCLSFCLSLVCVCVSFSVFVQFIVRWVWWNAQVEPIRRSIMYNLYGAFAIMTNKHSKTATNVGSQDNIHNDKMLTYFPQYIFLVYSVQKLLRK